jgi:hypothetical protein
MYPSISVFASGITSSIGIRRHASTSDILVDDDEARVYNRPILLCMEVVDVVPNGGSAHRTKVEQD